MFEITKYLKYNGRSWNKFQEIYGKDCDFPYKKYHTLSLQQKMKIPWRIINGIECWSQYKQDFYILELLNYKKNGYFIELGGYDGVSGSNTFTLEKNYNWNGICIEALDNFYKKCLQTRKCVVVKECVDSSNKRIKFLENDGCSGIIAKDCDNKNIVKDRTIKMKTKTLEEILDENNSPNIIDYFSLDVEGAEFRILEKFPFEKYKFLVLGIERPKKNLLKLLKKHNYIKLDKKGGQDTFFIHKDLQKKIGIII